MNERRRALGRGLGALIPTGSSPQGRPVDTFFAPPAQDRAAVEHEAAAEPNGFDAADATVEPSPWTTPASEGGRAAFDEATDEVHTEQEGRSSRAADGDAGALRPVPGAQFAHLPVDAIRPNPRQPRQSFDDDEMAELVHSIREIGMLQPVVVRPTGDEPTEQPTESASGRSFEIVMGERRWRAARAAGLEHIPAIVRHTNDDVLLRDALLENLHRSQLNPLEEAAAYQQLLDDFGCTKEELAHRIGRSRPQVSNTLRLLRLPPLVQRRVAAGVLSAGHARALLGLEDDAAIERLAARIVAEGLSVRTVEEIVAMGSDAPARRAPRRSQPPAELADVAARLSDRLDTRVHVAMGQRKGRLTVEFAGAEDLQRILDVMGVNLS